MICCRGMYCVSEAKRSQADFCRLLDSRTPEGKQMSIDSLHAEMTVILLAGADTIATAACSIISYILQSPEARATILDEFQKALKDSLLSPIPKHAEVVEHCPYYVACLKESMRLCPSVQSIFPRLVENGQALVLEGKQIPPGTEVACNPWITHRDKEIYGEDAEIWRPERWLENNGEAGTVLEKYDLSLGYGSRICLGRDLGMMELMKFPLMVGVAPFFERRKKGLNVTVLDYFPSKVVFESG